MRGLDGLEPDLIALQEVSLPGNTAQWLADELQIEHVYLSPKAGRDAKKEGIAILSRLPFDGRWTLDLETQNRVAQCVQVRIEGQPLLFANGHFLWQPGESVERQRQIERFMGWLQEKTNNHPVIVAGDFNATPESPTIQKMRQEFNSAYQVANGKEPDYTTPTPLPRSNLKLLTTLFDFIKYIRFKDFELGWQGTLDYIFVNKFVKVIDCQLVLDQPAPDNRDLYPSDHFGLKAILAI